MKIELELVKLESQKWTIIVVYGEGSRPECVFKPQLDLTASYHTFCQMTKELAKNPYYKPRLLLYASPYESKAVFETIDWTPA